MSNHKPAHHKPAHHKHVHHKPAHHAHSHGGKHDNGHSKVTHALPKPKTAGWKHQDHVNKLFKNAGLVAQQADDFAQLFKESSLRNWLDVYNNSVSSSQDIDFIAKFYIFLRKRGFSHAHIRSTFARVAKIPGTRRLDFIRKSVENSSKIERFIGVAGKGASTFDAFITLIDIYDLAYNGEWSQLAALVYKKLMGKAVPLAGLVDALQSLVEALVPGQVQKSSWVFKVIRSCDPVGLGGAGVDSMGFLAQAMIDKLKGKPFNEKRFSQLVQRLRTGPTAIFAELGDRIPIGELIYDIGEMSSSDWQKLGQRTLPDITSYVRSFKR